MNKHLRIILLASGASGVGLNVPALAVTESLPSRTVNYADLDLSKAAGAQTLYRRISAAAQQVCTVPGYESARNLAEHSRQQACVERAIDSAVRDVHSEALAGQHGRQVIQVARN